MAPLELVLPFCTTAELARVSLLDREHARVSELEWRQRVLARFGTLRFRPASWRKCFHLRTHLARKVVDSVSARVYLMNGRGETHFFPIASAKSLMCSRERAVVYNRCERMFDLSLRINRSIQEISALIGLVSIDEARGLLNEHINLMASVASLRGSLLFESELFQVFPAPVLLDANALLRGTFAFPAAAVAEDSDENVSPCEQRLSPRFVDSSTLMMQVWASIDGLIYRPLAPPSVLEPLAPSRPSDALLANDADLPGQVPPDATTPYASVKLHDLSGMTIHIDDNTLRYRLEAHEICVNALVSNSYLLYLFNPLHFRPLDWTFSAVVYVNDARFELPVTREGVFLNTSSYALRVFLSYGKIPETASAASASTSSSRPRGGDDSAPLDIPCAEGEQVVFFHLTATNRISKEVREVAAKTACLSTTSSSSSSRTSVDERAAQVAPLSTSGDDAQDALSSRKEDSTKASATDPTVAADAETIESTERHVHLPFDAMICYSFSSTCRLQYVEFAIGFEALMHQLGVSDFLVDAPAPPLRAAPVSPASEPLCA